MSSLHRYTPCDSRFPRARGGYRSPEGEVGHGIWTHRATVRILERLGVADIEIERLPVVVHRIPDPAPIKVLLGMNFVQKMKLVVNGKGMMFDLEDPP